MPRDLRLINMNLAILSSGPSLQAFLDNPVRHDAYIGVNRAAGAWLCDRWVALDARAFNETDPIGSPVIHTKNAYESEQFPPPARCRVLRDDETFAGFKGLGTLGSVPWRRWSGVYALVVGGVAMQAKRITLYGYDMAGHLYWDDVAVYRRSFVPPPKTLNHVRWRHERTYFDQVVEWLKGRQVEVVKV